MDNIIKYVDLSLKNPVILNINSECIFKFVENKTGFSMSDIRGRVRKQDLVFARALFCYIAIENTNYVYSQIMRLINKDRSNIYNYINIIFWQEKEKLHNLNEQFKTQT